MTGTLKLVDLPLAGLAYSAYNVRHLIKALADL